jgi:hypothetical protein
MTNAAELSFVCCILGLYFDHVDMALRGCYRETCPIATSGQVNGAPIENHIAAQEARLRMMFGRRWKGISIIDRSSESLIDWCIETVQSMVECDSGCLTMFCLDFRTFMHRNPMLTGFIAGRTAIRTGLRHPRVRMHHATRRATHRNGKLTSSSSCRSCCRAHSKKKLCTARIYFPLGSLGAISQRMAELVVAQGLALPMSLHSEQHIKDAFRPVVLK